MSDGQALNLVYLIAAALLFISVIASTLSARFGMPLLLIFLGIGMLAGEEGIIGIQYTNFFFTNFLGQIALAVILLDGGLRTSLQSFRLALKPASLLATWGVVATVISLGLFVAWILKVDWRFAFLMAAIVGSTDAAAVFSLLRNGGVRLNKRVQATLEIESGANDPMAILLVSAFVSLNLNPETQNISAFLILLLQQLGLGLILGLSSGYILSSLLPKINLAEGMYAILIFSGGTITFALSNLLGGSGFLAIYLSGLMIGNRKNRATEHVLQVMDGMAWMSQVVLFLVLGLLVTPSEILKLLPEALAIAAFLTLIARPLAVFSSLSLFRFNWREMAFISWVGLRGAVPVTLAIMPVMAGVGQANLLFNLTFAIVILSLLLQGMSIPKIAQLFKVRLPAHGEALDSREIWVGTHSCMNIYAYLVHKGSFAVGRNPEEIAKKINHNLRLFAFVRDGKVQFDNNLSLRSGDSVWYSVQTHADNEALAKIFYEGNQARFEKSQFFGEWSVSPQIKISDLLLLDEVKFSEEEKELSVKEFILQKSALTPVEGDVIELNEDWYFVVGETDEEGEIISVGLKSRPAEKH